MILFLDASSLVKLYVDETGSEDVRQWVAECDAVTVSRISRLEATSALARRGRERDKRGDDFAAGRQALADDWPTFAAVEVDLDNAERLVARHPLRAMDAIQLAAALSVAAKVPGDDLWIGCHDEALARAARSEGLKVRPQA